MAAGGCTDGPLLLDEEKLYNGAQWHPVVGYRLRPHVWRQLPAVYQPAQPLLIRLAQLRVLLEIDVDGVVEAVVVTAGDVRQAFDEVNELADREAAVQRDGPQVLVEDPGDLLHGGAHPTPLVGRRGPLELGQEVLEHGLRRADVVRVRVRWQRDEQVRRPGLVELGAGLPDQLRARGRRRADVVGHPQQP